MKKFIITIIVIACVLLIAIIGIAIANSQIAEITEDEAKAIVLESMNSQLSAIKSEYDLDDLTLDIKIYECVITKPTIFQEGYIHLDISDYLMSSEFVEIEEQKFDKEIIERYLDLSRELDFREISIENYFVNITKGEDTRFFDSKKNEYSFSVFDGEHEVFRNGDSVYSYRESSSELGEKCTVCYGKRTDIASQCSACGGRGYR